MFHVEIVNPKLTQREVLSCNKGKKYFNSVSLFKEKRYTKINSFNICIQLTVYKSSST